MNFKSFTELNQDSLGDKYISEAVASFVNIVSERPPELRPDLKIQFRLHTTSVKDHLEQIAKTENRVEILWEAFPYHYMPVVDNEDEFRKTIDFTEKY